MPSRGIVQNAFPLIGRSAFGPDPERQRLWHSFFRHDICAAGRTARPLFRILGIGAPIAAYTEVAGLVFLHVAGLGCGIDIGFFQGTGHFRLLPGVWWFKEALTIFG